MNAVTSSMNRAVGACVYAASFVGRCPTLVSNGPLALGDKVWNSDSESANGALPSQPGATPQEKNHKQNEG